MEKPSLFLKTLLTVLCLSMAYCVAAQQSANLKLKVYVKKNPPGHASLRYSDTFAIHLDCGFQNDVFKIKSGSKYFTTDTLNTDGIIGYAGTLKVPKTKGNMKIMVYLNDHYIGKLTLKKKFSVAHINVGVNKVTWAYTNYLFIYL
jgi:hypothetical protein